MVMNECISIVYTKLSLTHIGEEEVDQPTSQSDYACTGKFSDDVPEQSFGAGRYQDKTTQCENHADKEHESESHGYILRLYSQL